MKQDKQKTKVKLTYDDIKLNGIVNLPDGFKHLGKAHISCIDNTALLDGINEPIFSVLSENGMRFSFGLKYVLKNYVNQ